MKTSLLVLAFAACSLIGLSQNQKPNIIYIMSDDHDDDAISAYRLLRNARLDILSHTKALDKMAEEGMLFKNAFVSNSICSPVRATVLTGKFSHLNGIKDNVTPFDTPQYTFIKQMRASGYKTGIIGKWHLHIRPSGFDHFSILPGQGNYYFPRFVNGNDTVAYQNGYVTEEITRQAIEWLGTRDTSKPFALMIHHKAPHRNWVPALKYLETFSKMKFTEPLTLHADTTGKGKAYRDQQMSILTDMDLCSDLKIDPKYLEDIPHLKPTREEIEGYARQMKLIPEAIRKRIQEIYAERGKILESRKPSGKELLALKYQWYMQDYMACVASVDESVGQLLDFLDAQRLSENTIVFYTSDQGFYLGENGWFDKRFMYDVSMKTPLIVRWKGHIKSNVVSDALVQNIDLASTFLDVANLPIPEDLQGVSLIPLLTAKTKRLPRESLYYRYYEFPDPHHVYPHLGIRQEHYKLIYFYTINEWELFDLKDDPEEQINLVKKTRYKKIYHSLKQELIKTKKFYRDFEAAGELE